MNVSKIIIKYIEKWSVMLHLFSRLCRGKHLLAQITIKDPMSYTAIPNGSLFKWRGLSIKTRPPPI